RQFLANQIIFQQGASAPPPLYIATHGPVVLTKTDESGKIHNLAQLQAPTVFGEIGFFCQTSPFITATALGDVAAFSLSRKVFDELIALNHPATMRFVHNLARVVCHRLAVADEMLTEMVRDGDDLAALRKTIFAAQVELGQW